MPINRIAEARIACYCLFVLLAILFFVTPEASISQDQKPSVNLSYHTGDQQVRYLQGIDNQTFSLSKPDKFNVKVFVEPLKVEKDVISARFTPPRESLILSPPQNWSIDKTGAVTFKNTPSEAGQYEFWIDLSKEGLNTDDYPLFLFTLQHASALTMPKMHFEFHVHPQKKEQPSLILHSYHPIEVKERQPSWEIDFRNVAFNEKSYLYLLKRELNLSFDEAWQHTRYRDITVLQRRFDIPISESSVIQLFLKAGAAFRGINCSFDRDGDGKTDMTIYYQNIAHKTETNAIHTIETLLLLETFGKMNIDIKKARLKEIFIELPDDIHKIKTEQILEKITSYKIQQTIPSNLTSAGMQHHLMFEVRRFLTDHGIPSALIKKVRIAVFFEKGQTASFSVKNLLFFNVNNVKVPAIINTFAPHLSLCCFYPSKTPLRVIANPETAAQRIINNPPVSFKDPLVFIDNDAVDLNAGINATLEGKWHEAKGIKLDEGEHTVRIADNPYFTVKSVIFEAQSPYDPPALQTTPIKDAPHSLQNILVKIAKLSVFALLIFLIIKSWKRLKTYFQKPYSKLKTAYLLIPVKIWGILWLFISVLLYYIGITKPANPVKIWGILWLFISVLLYYIGITKPAKAGAENYAITFGGICFFISFAHLMRVTRDWFTSRFPKISAYVYRDRATPFFAGAICILAVVPFLLIAKMDIIAEHAAIIVYYSLVMGVILVFLEIKKADANKQDNDSPHDGKKC